MATKKSAVKKSATTANKKASASKKVVAPAKKSIVKKAAAKKSAPVEKAATIKKAASKKAATKPAVKKVAAPKKSSVAVKKSAAKQPVKKAAVKKVAQPVKKSAVKKSASAKATTVKKASAKPAAKKAVQAKATQTKTAKIKTAPTKTATKPSNNNTKLSSAKNTTADQKLKKAKNVTTGIPKKVKAEAQPLKEVKVPKISTKEKKSYNPSYTPLEERNTVVNPQTIVRYSEEELQEFKELILKKIEDTRREADYLKDIITRRDEMGGDIESRYMTMEDGSVSMDREHQSQMLSRNIQHIENLEKALVRIENKTYGVCRVTGELIDKARLRAVPHATMTLAAKENRKNIND